MLHVALFIFFIGVLLCVGYLTQKNDRKTLPTVFDKTYFTHFSDFKKRDVLRFFEMVYQKLVKVVSKSLVPLLQNEFT